MYIFSYFKAEKCANGAILAPIAHLFCSQYDNTMAADKDPQDKAKKKRGRNWTSREDDMLTKAWSADQYLNHLVLGKLIAVLSTKRLVVLTEQGKVNLVAQYTRIKEEEVVPEEYCVLVTLNSSSSPGKKICCPNIESALELCQLITKAMDLDATQRRLKQNFGQ